MARKKRKALTMDARHRKRMKREALMEEAIRKRKASRKAEVEAAGKINSRATEAKAIQNSAGNIKTINKTTDIKEVVKEVIVNNSENSSRVAELLYNNSKKLSKEQRKANDEELLNVIENDDMKVLASLLMEMRNKDDRKLKYTKIQVGIAMFTSIFALLIVMFVGIAVLSILPQINDIVEQANVIIAQTNETIAEANEAIVQANTILRDVQPVVDNLNTVTNDLANADITGMLKDVDDLVVSSEKNMGEALQTITDIDIKSLNDAIADLSAIVAPLASMFRR